MTDTIPCPQCGAPQRVPTDTATLLHCDQCGADVPVPPLFAFQQAHPAHEQSPEDRPGGLRRFFAVLRVVAEVVRRAGCLAVVVALAVVLALVSGSWWPILLVPIVGGLVILVVALAMFLFIRRAMSILEQSFTRTPPRDDET